MRAMHLSGKTISIKEEGGPIALRSDGFVICLSIHEPLALDWYDCAGSVGKYFVSKYGAAGISPAQEFSLALQNGTEQDIPNGLDSFMKLFSPGEYKIRMGEMNNCEIIYQEKGPNRKPILAGGYYPLNEVILFTQDEEMLSLERVRWYEEQIRAGRRPVALLVNADFCDEGIYPDGSKWMHSFDSSYFVLDGHHKLAAYKNLGIVPQALIITREAQAKAEYERHRQTLFFEYEHLLDEYFRRHIISHNPILLTDSSETSMRYNDSLDKYLGETASIEIALLELFVKASVATEPGTNQWLIDRLRVISSRLGSTKQLWLNYREVNEKYPHGIWAGIDIRGRRDFEKWLRQIFPHSYSRISKAL